MTRLESSDGRVICYHNDITGKFAIVMDQKGMEALIAAASVAAEDSPGDVQVELMPLIEIAAMMGWLSPSWRTDD